MTYIDGIHKSSGSFWRIPTVQPHWIHFARAITRPWVGQLGSLWYILVEEGLQFFLRYSGPISVDGKVFKNQVENWKIAIWSFFVRLLKTKISIMECPFLFTFLTMGWREIDKYTIEYKSFGIFGKKHHFKAKNYDTVTAVTMSQLQLSLLLTFWYYKSPTTVTSITH